MQVHWNKGRRAAAGEILRNGCEKSLAAQANGPRQPRKGSKSPNKRKEPGPLSQEDPQPTVEQMAAKLGLMSPKKRKLAETITEDILLCNKNSKVKSMAAVKDKKQAKKLLREGGIYKTVASKEQQPSQVPILSKEDLEEDLTGDSKNIDNKETLHLEKAILEDSSAANCQKLGQKIRTAKIGQDMRASTGFSRQMFMQNKAQESDDKATGKDARQDPAPVACVKEKGSGKATQMANCSPEMSKVILQLKSCSNLFAANF